MTDRAGRSASPAAGPWHERGRLRNVVADSAYSPFTPPWKPTGRPAMSVPFGTLDSARPAPYSWWDIRVRRRPCWSRRS